MQTLDNENNIRNYDYVIQFVLYFFLLCYHIWCIKMCIKTISNTNKSIGQRHSLGLLLSYDSARMDHVLSYVMQLKQLFHLSSVRSIVACK